MPLYLFVYLLFMVLRAEAEVEVFLRPRPASVRHGRRCCCRFSYSHRYTPYHNHSLIGIALGDSWRRRRISELCISECECECDCEWAMRLRFLETNSDSQTAENSHTIQFTR